MARKLKAESSEIGRLIEQANLFKVAEQIGIQVDRRARSPRRAICPFHDDKDPSLNFFQGKSGKGHRDHYHCFVCGAHGDAIALIQNFERVNFWEAVQRLAVIEGFALSSSRRPQIDRSTGANILAKRIYAANSTDQQFEAFAASRGFSSAFLHARGVARINLANLSSQAETDRVLEEQLVESGVLRREIPSISTPDLFGPYARAFFRGDRIVFQIDGPSGDPVGFAARALDNSKPKYLYSYDFPRRTILYGEGRIHKTLLEINRTKKKGKIDIYLVEGILDALRLEQLGFFALAVLGAQMTPGQIERVARIQELVGDLDLDLTFYVFFDIDDAGRRGAYDAIMRLLGLLQNGHPFDLRVVIPSTGAGPKIDPDSLLRELTPGVAQDVIVSSTVGVFDFIIAYRLGVNSSPVDWSSVNRLRLASIARSVAYAMHDVDWDRIVAPLTATEENYVVQQFVLLLRNYSGKADKTRVSYELVQFRSTFDDRSSLLTALTLGRSSTSRREYPLEDDAWERLAVAASPLFHVHRERLAVADGPSSPLLTRHMPKGGGKYRLKAGPVAHDVILQQYALIELLRDRDECPTFSDSIPAVRYVRDGEPHASVYKTGQGSKQPALSFAYQIDMAIVNGLAPPRREGLFRPYFECWRSFVDFLDQRIRLFRYDEVQILRLDVTGFYDHIRPEHFGDMLTRPLERALHSLHIADGGIGSFASLLAPRENKDAASRSEAFTAFLIQHSFGLRYFHPSTGEEDKHDPNRGIPQGPDLSAYLANIYLFDLDDLMGAEVARLNEAGREVSEPRDGGACSAAYARYVDDIVIICRDFETAAQMRRKIESLLALKGLSLNRKNVTPPSMSRAQARGWITDNRAGFGFSGPLADLPSTEAMDPLADAGEIDRRTALGLIFDPELDNPHNRASNLSKIRIALSAADLRFNDRANAYRRLWCIAAHTGHSSGEGLAASFVGLLDEVEARALSLMPETDRLDIALAAVEGLDRALRSTVPSDRFAEEVHAQIAANLQALATCVLDDPFTALDRLLLGSEQGSFVARFDVRCQIGIVACLAAAPSRPDGPRASFDKLHKFLLSSSDVGRPLPDGLLHSLLKHDAAFKQPVSRLVVASERSASAALSRLDQTLVELQRAAIFGPDQGPTMFDPADVRDPNAVVSVAQSILSIWTPGVGSEGHIPTDLDFDSAATLVNITYPIFSRIAVQRPRLTQLITGEQEAVPLPSPPGLKASGILLWCPNGRLLLASPNVVEEAPLGVTWSDSQNPPLFGVHLREATLPPGALLLCSENRKWSPSEIASLYRAGFPIFWRQLSAEIARVPVPTAFSFFAVVSEGLIDLSSLHLICWSSPRSSVDGHAFVRVGTSLEACGVYSEGADLWRYGWAIRDVCDRAEPSYDDDAGLDAQAATPLEREFHRTEAIVARVLPRLSGADRWGPGEGTTGNPIPSRIRRALSLLEKFDRASTSAEAASFLIAAVSEGMFMSERLNAPHDPTSNGNVAEFLARATGRVSRALPEAAKHWQRVTPQSLPYRRTAHAWQRLSGMIGHAGQGLSDVIESPFKALQAGTEILAAISDLRALAFEIAASLPEESIRRLSGAHFDPAWISNIVGLDLVLLNGDAAVPDTSIAAQTSGVMNSFCRLLLDRSPGMNVVRDRVTPAGWVVIIAVLVQLVPVIQKSDSVRPELWQAHLRHRDVEEALRKLLRYFGAGAKSIADAPNWPWDVFDHFLPQRPLDLPLLLRQITDASAIEVSEKVSWSNPRTGESQDGRPIMRLADGSSASLAEWQIDVAYVRGERGAAVEAYRSGARVRYPYSISRRGDEVLGLHLVSRKLGEMAFGTALPDPVVQAELSSAPEVAYEVTPAASSSDETPAIEGTASVVQDDQSTEAMPAPTGLEAAIEVVRVKQVRSWKERSATKNTGAHRVALVQWDVTDSYFGPGYKGGNYEGLVSATGHEAADPKLVKKGGVFLSTSEYRRRTLIREVLKACVEFKVDGLVFPEYSLRPETINWLARQLKTQPIEITVWCGTFRVPSATQVGQDSSQAAAAPFVSAITESLIVGINRWDAHTAVLTCLSSKVEANAIKVEHFARQKRYPSAAAGELIRPPSDKPWHPLLIDEKNPFKLGAFSLELICSEIFPHASSANFIGIIEENKELAERYGLAKSSETTFSHISKDVYEFARWTAYRNPVTVDGDFNRALVRGQAFQRTLIVLPAMTTRSADYHIFGQNQYLAAGLVTAFCNAVLPQASCGQSGFIGLDGWKQTEGIKTPYGSKAPGIFQLGGSHSGPLGETEAAMVIADLDLLRTADQRPRPHYQHRSLRLVAHLPIFFATEKGSHDGQGAYPNRRRQLRTRTVDGRALSFAEARGKIAEALELESAWRSKTNTGSHTESVSQEYQSAIAVTLEALRVLEEFADDSGWLRKRTESFRLERYDMPPMSPLPALVDWLYVDDRWLPDTKGVEPPSSEEDPLKSDKPLLSVPRSMQDEPPRSID